MIKIIKKGHVNPKPYKTTCNTCKTVFTCLKDDGRYVPDSRDGDAIVVKCPGCNEEIWIAVELFK